MSDVEDDTVAPDTEDDKPTQEPGEGNQELVQNLTQDCIQNGLSLLCKTGNGLAHAFIKLDLKEKGLSDISAISSFIHIRFLDLSQNRLKDLSPLASLAQLLWLKVDSNAIESFKGQPFAQMTFLQWMSMAMNLLTDLQGLVGPSLENLNLTGNSIQKLIGLESGCFANLATLELRGNQLDTTEGINLPNLRKLYLAQNAIKRLEGLERLERLTTLHLRENHIETLDGFNANMKCLQYLNVRGNVISDEKGLQSLRFLSKTLQTLVLLENPLVEIADYRINVVMILPNLERLDKDPVSAEEKAETQEKLRELHAFRRNEEVPPTSLK